MTQLDINGVSTEFNPSFQTWRDLLFDLESRRLGTSEVIASVKFNGDEVPYFRSDDVLGQPLKSIDKIGIEAVALKEMAQSALQEAEIFLKSLEKSMGEVAENFRTGLAGPANSKLQQLLAGVKMLAALARGIELTLGAGQNGASAVEHTLEQMRPTLEDLISAQEKQDWTLVADTLEYELLAYFSGFEQTLNGFKRELELR